MKPLMRYPTAVSGQLPAGTSNYNLVAVPDSIREAALVRAAAEGLPPSLRHVLLALLTKYAAGEIRLTEEGE